MADGDPVSRWVDSSGWGHNATQTGTARPTFKTNVINGKPVVRFSSTVAQVLSVASPWSNAVSGDTMFIVNQGSLSKLLWNLTSGVWGSAGMGLLMHNESHIYMGNAVYGQIYYATRPAGVHIYTSRTGGGENALSTDGTNTPITYGGGIGTTEPYGNIGSTDSDGDIAEIIVYGSALALRAKLVLLMTALIATGELPPPAELDAMAGHRGEIKKYLHEHGAHPTKAQLDAVVTPMAVGDRANIEKYLGTKYGITVAGGTAADPSTVAGLQGWWKADSPWGVVDDQWETATTTGTALGGGGNQEAGQAFTSTGGQLSYVTFGTYVGSATGPITAKLYSMSAGLPATLLATSDPLEGLTMPQSSHAYAPLYIFSGANRVQLTAGTQYAIALAFTGVNTVFATNGPGIGPQGMSMTRQNAGSWVGNQGGTLRFAVYVLK
jgi:hypothetical protein